MSLDRAARERDLWNRGVSRKRLERAWSHAGAFWDDEVDRSIVEAFGPHLDGAFLEIGSSTWHSWIHRLGLSPRSLDCVNISEREIERGRAALAVSRVKPTFHVMDAHRLGFADASFDVVFGKAILHHLDYATALDEFARVLKPGGVMVFLEPLDFNPVGKIVRALTPDARTPDEAPVARRHLALIRERFDVDLRPVQFLAAAASPVSALAFDNPENPLTRAAFAFDRAARRAPGLRLWFRSALIVGRKPDRPSA